MKKPPQLEDPCKALQILSQDLRDPDGGCPWDVKQTHLSVLENLIEETYEVADAVENLDSNKPGTFEALKEELGDLLFQVVFHSQMAKEANKFDFNDVARGVVEKLVRRHPHVYETGQNSAQKNSDQVLANWEAIKRKEKEENDRGEESMLSGIPGSLPALLKAYRIGHKVSRVNFDWFAPDGTDELFKKVEEEYDEFRAELPPSPEDFKDPRHDQEMASQKERAQEEIGDLLFVVAQLARHYHIDPEFALQRANKKFQTRFEKMEKRFQKRLSQNDYPSLDEWENAWSEVKAELKHKEP